MFIEKRVITEKSDVIVLPLESRKMILVVEDDPINLILIKKILKNVCECDSASTKEEALTKVKENKYSLVLMDIMLKGANGFDLINEIKEIPDYQNVAIAAITAYIDKANTSIYTESGFNHYFLKPFDINLLVKYVGDLLYSAENSVA